MLLHIIYMHIHTHRTYTNNCLCLHSLDVVEDCDQTRLRKRTVVVELMLSRKLWIRLDWPSKWRNRMTQVRRMLREVIMLLSRSYIQIIIIIICPIAIAYSMGQIIQEAPLPRRAQRVRRAYWCTLWHRETNNRSTANQPLVRNWPWNLPNSAK